MKQHSQKPAGLARVLPLLCGLCAVAFVLMLVTLLNPKTEQAAFVPPPFDASARPGRPEAPAELGWSELFQQGMSFRAGICGNLLLRDNAAQVYFYSSEENTVWLKLRLCDEGGNILAETGLIRPGEHIPTVGFTTLPRDGQPITMKIMSYEPDTYYSMGSVALSTTIHVE